MQIYGSLRYILELLELNITYQNLTRDVSSFFQSSSWGAACQISDPANSTISAEDKIQIVNLHNDLRRRIALGNETRGLTGPQPKASNMRQLVLG